MKNDQDTRQDKHKEMDAYAEREREDITEVYESQFGAEGAGQAGYEFDGPGAASLGASGAELLAGVWEGPKTPPAFQTSFTLGSGCC